MSNTVLLDNNIYRFKCPHCNINIEVLKNQVNCKIFRCGIYKSTGKPIPPHTKKPECDRLVNQNLIYGCSKPFTMDGKNVNICDYI